MADIINRQDWRIVIHEAEEGGYWGEVPAMPGCVSEGETLEECRANVMEAARGCLDTYLSVPVPHHGNKPLKQGTLNGIFNACGMEKPQR